jgi:hypothetical protein
MQPAVHTLPQQAQGLQEQQLLPVLVSLQA